MSSCSIEDRDHPNREEEPMARTSRKSNARAAKAGNAERATRKRKAPARTRAAPDEEARFDACDLEFHESEGTPDAELPEAKGGVEIPRGTARRAAHRRM
jgi:hypothetical protein